MMIMMMMMMMIIIMMMVGEVAVYVQEIIISCKVPSYKCLLS